MSKKDDWFRNDRWGPDEEADFFKRLSKCRSAHSKAQSARIKAAGLFGSGDRVRIRAAIDLVKRVVREWPVDPELAACHWLLAKCHATLGDLDQAVDGFRRCFRQERAFPNARTTAWSDFGRFVVERGLKHLYDEALEALDANVSYSPFPVDKFVRHAVRSIILSERGRSAEARREAEEAMRQAMRSHSGMANHPTLGLVQREERLTKKLRPLLEDLS